MAKKTLVPAEPMAQGVDALIARLREEGVAAGQQEADRLLSDARSKARAILEQANAEAQSRLESAQKESDTYRAAGEAALKTAMRDTILDMKAVLMQRFSADVKRFVSRELQDPELLRRLILELVSRAAEDVELDEADYLEFILPAEVAGLDELRSKPDELRKGPLSKLVFGLTADMLRDGVSFSTSDELAGGIRIEMQDEDIVLDLTDEAVAGLLLLHLQPRFRAILEGIVK